MLIDLDLNIITKRIKEIIPESIKREIYLFFVSSRNPQWMKYANISKKKVFVFLAGFYQNLGDMAITYAQVQFLTSVFPDALVIPIASDMTYKSIKTIKRYIKPEDVITITGGGNMDDLYLSLEEARRFVVKSFPNNRIISFPQTVHFSNTPHGNKERENSRKIYESHKNLIMFVREERSLERSKHYFPNAKIELCPDIVLSLKYESVSSKREGAICCLRKDKEQLIGLESREEIIKAAKDMFKNVLVTDTNDISNTECLENEYENTLNYFWDKLLRSQVVVTDRLHCMIFCVITETPCVVIDNNNQKVSSVYNTWLKNYPFIKMITNYDPISVTNEMLTLSKRQMNDCNIGRDKDFLALKEALIEQ